MLHYSLKILLFIVWELSAAGACKVEIKLQPYHGKTNDDKHTVMHLTLTTRQQVHLPKFPKLGENS